MRELAEKKYFDAIGGIFVAVLGHRHPRLLRAMQVQMEKIKQTAGSTGDC
jgi:adenosylmethionine-8-amino-7-oxononanoate aminotransferase